MKGFFTRLMQVLWVLTSLLFSLSVSPLAIGNFSEDAWFFIIIILVWALLLVIVQYLIFSKLNPNVLFNKKNFLTKLSMLSIVLAIILGSSLNIYQSYTYKKKLKAGNDVDFFNERIRNVVYKYGSDECFREDEQPKGSRIMLVEEANKLNKQGINGLAALLVMANRDDDLGFVIRCSFDDGLDSKDLAEIAEIDY